MAARATGRKRRWWLLGVLAGLVVLAVLAAFALTRPQAAKGPAYDVLTVTRSDQTETVALSGTIEPQSKANATFKVPGTVDSVTVKVGDRVARGDSLATVQTRDLDDAVALASAQVTAAKAQQQTIADADQATDAQKTAAAAQVRSAEAALANAKNRRSDATLVSPLAGTVAKVDLAVGDQVTGSAASTSSLGSSGSGLGGMAAAGGLSGLNLPASGGSSGAITVISTDAWQLDATVGTADLPRLKAGQAVVVTPTGTTNHVTGVVDTVGAVASAETGSTPSFPVTVKITQGGVPLFAGSSADAVVTTATRQGVLTVPVNAVTTTTTGSNRELN